MNNGVKGMGIRWKQVPRFKVKKTSESKERGLDGMKGMRSEHIVLCRKAEFQ